LEENEDVLAEALEKDLGRCKHEAYVAEYSTTLAEAKEAVSSLSKWMKPTGSVIFSLLYLYFFGAITLSAESHTHYSFPSVHCSFLLRVLIYLAHNFINFYFAC